MRSSSEGLVGRSELGTFCAGIGREPGTTAGGREAAGRGGAAETVGFGASQASAGTREAAAALPTAVVRKVDPDVDEIPAEGRGAEGMAGLGGAGAAPLRKDAMSTFPTGV